jgi:hypothetical protein
MASAMVLEAGSSRRAGLPPRACPSRSWGRCHLPDDLDEIQDLLTDVLGEDSEVTGPGPDRRDGISFWNFDQKRLIRKALARLAPALVDHHLGG